MPTTICADLEDPAARIRAFETADPVGVDTEFMRERTYFPRLCLVQVATRDALHFIDPLTEDDLADTWNALLDREWVVHSARQDLEVVHQSTSRLPSRLFDTQIAAALAGFAPQIGYANLVRELCGTELEKSHTRADWTRRPLTDAMLDYAADDVAFLIDLRDALTDRLDGLGRLEWAAEDSAALLDPALYAADAAQATERLRAARNLRGRARQAAVRLARWREQRAIDADRPRQWILKDSVLIDLARTNPRDVAALAKVEGMPRATVRRSGSDLLGVLSAADGADCDHQPPERPGEAEKARQKTLQGVVAAAAGELGIAPEIIASRRELAALVRGERGQRVLSGWRAGIVGERLLESLDEAE